MCRDRDKGMWFFFPFKLLSFILLHGEEVGIEAAG